MELSKAEKKRLAAAAWYQKNKAKVLARNEAWAKANPEAKRAHRRAASRLVPPEEKKAKYAAWQAANPEKRKALDKKRYLEDREGNLARHKEWLKKNPDKRRIHETTRRTKKTQAGGKYTLEEWIALCAQFHYMCPCCGRDDVKLTVDHIVPVSKGGTSNIDNIQPLCARCNSIKGAREVRFSPANRPHYGDSA